MSDVTVSDTSTPIPHDTSNAKVPTHDLEESISDTPWAMIDAIVREQDDIKIKRIHKTIDALLIFAGLYSAALTALLVDSYKSLLPESPEVSVNLLRQVTEQTASYVQAAGYLNATTSTLVTTFRVAASDVAVNTCWFASLVFSLGTASVAIWARQLLEQKLIIPDSMPPATRVRERYKRRRRLDNLKLFEIAAVLSRFLQIALALFFAGLCILTRFIHPKIWVTSMVLVFCWAAFILPWVVMDLVRSLFNIPLIVGAVFKTEKDPDDLDILDYLDASQIDTRLLRCMLQVFPRHAELKRKLKFAKNALTRRVDGAKDVSLRLQICDALHSVAPAVRVALQSIFVDAITLETEELSKETTEIFQILACATCDPVSDKVTSALHTALVRYEILALLFATDTRADSCAIARAIKRAISLEERNGSYDNDVDHFARVIARAILLGDDTAKSDNIPRFLPRNTEFLDQATSLLMLLQRLQDIMPDDLPRSPILRIIYAATKNACIVARKLGFNLTDTERFSLVNKGIADVIAYNILSAHDGVDLGGLDLHDTSHVLMRALKSVLLAPRVRKIDAATEARLDRIIFVTQAIALDRSSDFRVIARAITYASTDYGKNFADDPWDVTSTIYHNIHDALGQMMRADPEKVWSIINRIHEHFHGSPICKNPPNQLNDEQKSTLSRLVDVISTAVTSSKVESARRVVDEAIERFPDDFKSKLEAIKQQLNSIAPDAPPTSASKPEQAPL